MTATPRSALDPWPNAAPHGAPIPKPPHDAERLPRISVVIPSFEQGRFLESAIRSVLLQGYPNLELMVVDGGSRDESLEVIARYRDRLDWSVSAPDRGQAHAINQGFARSSGTVLGWLNADDILLPGSLLTIGRAFADRPHLDAVAGFRREIAADGTIGAPFIRDRPTAGNLRRYCCLAQETVYISRRVFSRLGGLDEDRAFALDYEYWLRMLESGFHFTLLPAYLGGLRDHPGTKRANLDIERRRDLRVLAARYGLGTNEEDAWLRGGDDHALRLAMLEDLSASPIARLPRLTSGLLRLLDVPRISLGLVALYRRYRIRRPRHGVEVPGHATAILGTLGDVLRRRPVDALSNPRDPEADALLGPRLGPSDLAGNSNSGSRDRLALGRGWSWPEQAQGRAYRWARSGAEILVLAPSGAQQRLRLGLESGPSVDWRDAPVALVDEAGREVANHRLVNPHSPRSGEDASGDDTAGDDAADAWTIDLPIARGPAVRRYRLEITGAGGRPAAPEDPRVLDFRATQIGWAPTSSPTSAE